MRVPFGDLFAQYESIKPEIDAAIAGVIKTSAYVGGPAVRNFEQQFALACGARHCIAVANGTDAIYILLRMLGIGAGDEVIVPAVSWIATSEVVTQAGAKVVFADIDELHGLTAAAVARHITPRTRAVIPVHLYGQPADIGAIAALCAERRLELIEDCAQAHLAKFAGRTVGTFGRAATFSFYPGKNLGAYGDAGAIVTDDASLAQQCRMFANHGALVKHEHQIEGINSRLDGLQAALLSVKLPHLARWTERRREIAGWYDAGLAGVGAVKIPGRRADSTHVFHLYVVQVENRTGLRARLTELGIETQIHYPTPLPLLPAYAYLGRKPDEFPVAYRAHQRILSLPIYPEMSREMVEHVCAGIAGFYR
jgi:dTDP-4-amino-4,6-dideoxygalactose transaminase